MNYEITRTEKADIQIREIIYYIADDSGSVEIAIAYLDKLEHAICLLSEQPYYGAAARHLSLRKLGFRVLVAEQHLVFYKVREQDSTVIIYAVLDSRRDYRNLVI